MSEEYAQRQHEERLKRMRAMDLRPVVRCILPPDDCVHILFDTEDVDVLRTRCAALDATYTVLGHCPMLRSMIFVRGIPVEAARRLEGAVNAEYYKHGDIIATPNLTTD